MIRKEMDDVWQITGRVSCQKLMIDCEGFQKFCYDVTDTQT